MARFQFIPYPIQIMFLLVIIHQDRYMVRIHSSCGNSHRHCQVKTSEPLLRLELDETCCWAMDWANSEVIAVGCTNGTSQPFGPYFSPMAFAGNIAIYDVGKAIKGGQKSSKQHCSLMWLGFLLMIVIRCLSYSLYYGASICDSSPCLDPRSASLRIWVIDKRESHRHRKRGL